jgi:hypothetical protein
MIKLSDMTNQSVIKNIRTKRQSVGTHCIVYYTEVVSSSRVIMKRNSRKRTQRDNFVVSHRKSVTGKNITTMKGKGFSISFL